MKITVTGGAGYTGTLLSKALLDAGHHVTIVDNFLYGCDSILPFVSHPNLTVVKQDIRNDDMSYVVGQDIVVHLAAISGYPACEANPHSANLINYVSTVRLAKAMAPEQTLIFASSTSFYGSTGTVSDETSEVKPVSLYGLTKWEGEKAVMDRKNSISLRWATVFGSSPRMRAGLLVNDLVERAVHERAMVLYDSHSMRTFIHISDMIRGYMFAIENRAAMMGGIFNMGSEKLNYSKRQIAEQIVALHPSDIIESKLGDTDIRHFYVCFNKIKTLGFDCEVTLEQGIKELIKLYRFYNPNAIFKTI